VTAVFSFSRSELESERDAAAARVAERPGKVSYQRLGRALRWLDDEAAARDAFGKGAEHMQANVFAKGRSQNASGWLEYGLLLRHAGDAESAREWFAKALDDVHDADAVRRAQLRYLLGERPGPVPDAPVWEQALSALTAGANVAQARAAVEDAIARERGLPSYTAPSMTLWDLLEATYRAETPELSHAEMLERSGFLAS
jgi:tetratricopeptide (TPR) repeat protein